MRLRLYPALATALIVSACATGRGPPPPPPPPTGPVHILDTTKPVEKPTSAPAGRAVSRSTPAGTLCRYCVTNDASKRQYFDQRRKRYYYFDRARKGYFWENGDYKL